MYHKLPETKIKKIKITKKIDSEKEKRVKMIKKLKINPILKWLYIRDLK